MKTCALLLWLMAALFLGAQEAQVAAMQEVPWLRLIGGEEARVAVQISTAQAARLTVRAEVVQIAGRVVAPVARDLPVATELACDGSSLQPRTFRFTPPGVRQPTAMELRFTAQAAGAADWQPAGTVRLIVYPADLLRRIAAVVAQSGRPLVVLGGSPRLRSALRLAAVRFSEVESAPGTAVYLSEEEAAPPCPAAASLLWFKAEPALPAGVYRTGRITKATLPVLEDFATSPDRQLLFLTLLQQTLASP